MKKNAANIMSLSNLLFGMLSVYFSIAGQYTVACIMVLMSVLLDGFDGRVARHFHCESELGKQLDSLCDLVGFGVAPAMLLYFFIYPLLGNWGFVFSMAYVVCGAYRLARFNVLNIHDYFVGVPITIAGMAVGLLGLLHALIPSVCWLLLAVLLSYLMVCTLKVKKF